MSIGQLDVPSTSFENLLCLATQMAHLRQVFDTFPKNFSTDPLAMPTSSEGSDSEASLPCRSHSTCPFKCARTHPLRRCYMFSQFKQLCSVMPYVGNHLLSEDAAGFCAAGVIPYCRVGKRIALFMLTEVRHGSTALNFAGGGRETMLVSHREKRPETHFETASNEFREEVGDLVGEDHPLIDHVTNFIHNDKPTVFWSGVSKYVGVSVPVPKELMFAVTLQECIPKTAEAVDFKIVYLDELASHKFHGFIYPMIQYMKSRADVFFP